MAVPQNREEFSQFCLRKLGFPVIEINVDPDTIEDRIDEALDYWYQFAFDATEHVYWSYQLTSEDIANKFVTTPPGMTGVVQIFPISDLAIGSASDIFSVRYQIALNDLYNLSSVSMVPYTMARQQLSVIEEILVGQQPLRFNRHTSTLYIDMDWTYVSPGEWIVIEGYQNLDPTTYPAIWSERWLQRYATALIQENWGQNLIKFSGMQLPGGIQFNGQQIYSEAVRKKEALEEEMRSTYSEGPLMLMG